MKVHLRKVNSTMLGFEPDAVEYMAGVKVGDVIVCEVTRPRNYRFLKKYFALLNLAFDYWEPGEGCEYKGQPIEKNFERFRKDTQILAGYGTPVWNIRGELRMESQSISFGKMTEETFGKLYDAVVTVLIRQVLAARGFDREAVDSLVDQIAGFA